MTKSITKREPFTLATNLRVIQSEIAKLEEAETKLKTELLETLKRQGVRTVKMVDGTMYVRAEKNTLQVKTERLAWGWAMENPEARMKIDTNAALKAFRGKKLPAYFTRKVTEYLSIKHPNSHEYDN